MGREKNRKKREKNTTQRKKASTAVHINGCSSGFTSRTDSQPLCICKNKSVNNMFFFLQFSSYTLELITEYILFAGGDSQHRGSAALVYQSGLNFIGLNVIGSGENPLVEAARTELELQNTRFKVRGLGTNRQNGSRLMRSRCFFVPSPVEGGGEGEEGETGLGVKRDVIEKCREQIFSIRFQRLRPSHRASKCAGCKTKHVTFCIR